MNRDKREKYSGELPRDILFTFFTQEHSLLYLIVLSRTSPSTICRIINKGCNFMVLERFIKQPKKFLEKEVLERKKEDVTISGPETI